MEVIKSLEDILSETTIKPLPNSTIEIVSITELLYLQVNISPAAPVIDTIAGDDTSHGWEQLIRLTTQHSTVRTAVKPKLYSNYTHTQFHLVHFKQKFKIRGQLDTQCAAMFRVCCVNKHEIMKYILNSFKTINTNL